MICYLIYCQDRINMRDKRKQGQIKMEGSQKEEFFQHLEIQENDETREEIRVCQNRNIKSTVLQMYKRIESNKKSRQETNSILRVELQSEENEVRPITSEEMIYLTTFEVDEKKFIIKFLRDQLNIQALKEI